MRILPPYTVVDAVLFDSSGKTLAETRNRQAEFKGSVDPDPYHWKNNTFDYILAGIHFVIWCFVLYAIEQGWSCKCLSRLRQVQLPKQKDLVLDEDVKAEAMRVEKSEERMKIRVEKLRKVYMTGIGPCSRGQPFLAVENLSFGLSAGECFALLGVNGAGKSTTFKILTTEVTPTNGSIEINGVSIAEDSSQLSKQIGYCPQTNPIFEEMSVDEHLYYFARIKGIPDKLISELVEEAVNELNLQDHRHKPAGALSGGNKRKLAVAMAIVGRPSIILLDEPSAGMDPEARRFMWKVVAKIASNKTSAVILTTHSMDEAEALSTKMGIMVKGGIFKCFGSAQRIRNKFGQGYIVEIKIA
jgi:ATP-binding cassette, subfamily A (ABC1), member 3